MWDDFNADCISISNSKLWMEREKLSGEANENTIPIIVNYSEYFGISYFSGSN